MNPDQVRRLKAKQLNERIKLTAGLANNLAVGVLVGGLVGPVMAGHSESWGPAIALFGVAAILHSYGQFLLMSLKSEE